MSVLIFIRILEVPEESASVQSNRSLLEPARRRRVALSKPEASDSELIGQLQALGYVSGSQKPTVPVGVSSYDAQRAYPGYNLVVSGHAPSAVLMDMMGRTVHSWTFSASDAWPDVEFTSESPSEGKHRYWRRARLLPDGGLLAVFEGIGLIKLDRESRLVWEQYNGAHHDLDVSSSGGVYVLGREAHVKPSFNPNQPVLEDFIVVLDENGEERRRVSILDALTASPYYTNLDALSLWGDITHTNTIEVLEDVPLGVPAVFAEGRVLISSRYLDMIGLVDLDQGLLVWAESGFWSMQHQPTLLDSGKLLVFDNLGAGTFSRVVEYDPASRKIVWLYGEAEEQRFFTETCGSAQRLPNGNTLVTVSDPGWAFEITRDGETVWKYGSPYRAGDRGQLVATLFEVVRIEASTTSSWLERDGSEPATEGTL